jgi:CPA2 family monovalent cation:H+ antiporter-2
MEASFLGQAVVYLAAAVFCVPLAKKAGLSSVLGYLIAGIIIGPYILGWVGDGGQDIMHVGEFGVVMMLFIIGLELEPAKFWAMRKSILGLGSMQLVFSALALFFLFTVMEYDWQTSITAALALSLSSTAIVLQTLKEKGISNTSAGKASFAVLLFQDIAVIPILAFIPLIGKKTIEEVSEGSSLLQGLPSYIQPFFVILSIALVYFGGRYLVVPLLRQIARTGLSEVFTAAALLLVVAVSLLMELVGLSPALGAFMGGVVLAGSEFRHELESDIAPFKGLLLGLFFIAVGSSINFDLIFSKPVLILSLTAGILIIKFVILIMAGKAGRLKSDQNLIFSFGLCQAGEFGFVIFTFADKIEVLPHELTSVLMAVITVSMAITPLLLLFNERLIDPFFGVKEKADEKEADTILEKHKVLIAGFGHFGSTVGRLLRANGIEATILDNDSERVELLRRMGFKVYYGDATRLELLKAAGIDGAKIFIAAVDSPETNKKLIKTVSKHFPQVKILARARNRIDSYELIEMGVKNIYRETLYTAVHLGVDALSQLGIRKYTATRQGQKFIHYDEMALEKLAKKRHDKKEYILSVKQEIELQEQLLQNDLNQNLSSMDTSWDSEYLKNNL